jgi:hypothetical protein
LVVVKRVARLKAHRVLLLLGALQLTAFAGGCVADLPPANGSCVVAPALDCTVAAEAGKTPQDVGLTGYACTGTARPDDTAYYAEGVPHGHVCADRAPSPDGVSNYCCSEAITNCALDPAASCAVAGQFGYQCRGASRPDVFNAALTCTQGVRDDLYINYCCTGLPPPPKCTEKTGRCGGQYTGFNCPAGVAPLGSDLKSSESHANNYRFLCQTPSIAADEKTYDYCCYMAAPTPEGSSCLGSTSVPGCDVGHFGFACTGVDTPAQDYPVMVCPTPGVPGTSLEGYAATLYCCDYQ